MTGEVTELSETSERFHRVTLEDHDEEDTECSTLLPAAENDPIDVVSIYKS